MIKSKHLKEDLIDELMEPLFIDKIDPRIKYADVSPAPKEIVTARFLVKHYNVDIIFLPIRDIDKMRNPDIMLGRHFAEMKCITGSIKAVSRNFRAATKQAHTIVLDIKSQKIKDVKEIHNAVHGEIEYLILEKKWDARKPKHLIILFKDKLYSWKLSKGSKSS